MKSRFNNIKKIFTIIVILLTLTSNAQYIKNVGVSLGNTFHDKMLRNDQYSHPLINVLVNGEYYINDKLVINAGIGYQQYKIKTLNYPPFTYIENTSTETNSITSHYITVPILMSFKNQRKINILFGTTIEYNIATINVAEYTLRDNSTGTKTKNDDYYNIARNRFNIFVTTGLKYNFINKDKYKINTTIKLSGLLNGYGGLITSTLSIGISYNLSKNINKNEK